VAEAEGVEGLPSCQEVMRDLKAQKEDWQKGMKESSILQDVRSGRKTEVDEINGAIVDLAEKHDIAVPVNRTLTYLVKAKEERILV
jgi:ketopantoate reductase